MCIDIDQITLNEIRQTGARGIVTALHAIPYGEVWSKEGVALRRGEIEAAGLVWSVCESLPIHEDIKRGTGHLAPLFANYRQSMANLASEGIETICYNFMPVLDWTRTTLDWPLSTGGTCLRFDAVRMAAFEVHMLAREGAEADYAEDVLAKAAQWFELSTARDQETLLASIMAKKGSVIPLLLGLTGSFFDFNFRKSCKN